MKNLNYITCTEINEFNAIKISKNLVVRRRLNRITPQVDTDYDLYLNNFGNIQNSTPTNYRNIECVSLRKCYSSHTAALANLKDRIFKAQTVEFQNTCAYCLLRTVSTIDHYIPQTPYPVYSVLPKNLLPCCSTCNSTKNETWREAGRRTFIHFYNDNILNIQFLFGTLTFSGSVPSIQFNLAHSIGILVNDYGIIQNHFRILRLISSYELSTPKVIADMKIDVISLRDGFGATLTQDEIRRVLLSKSSQWKILYGINYWKAIAWEILANSNQFINTL